MYVVELEVVDDILNDQFLNLSDILKMYMKDNVKVSVHPISDKAWIWGK